MSQRELIPQIDDAQKELAEAQIVAKQKDSDFDIREYPVEVIVNKFTTAPEGYNATETELFIPDYQRELIWSVKQQSLLIESIMLDLPVPNIYVADIKGGENDGRIEIVDGSQRTRSLVRFLKNQFRLDGLELLSELNGFLFSDLPRSRQLRFKRKTIRIIELLQVDEEARRQIFYRLNSGGTKLKPMEERFGTTDGVFLTLLRKLASDQLFIELCPISASRTTHREREEMVLRFFAYRFDRDSYKKSVSTFMNDFMKKMNTNDTSQNIVFNEQLFSDTFYNMLNFVKDNFQPLYFRKSENNSSVPRVRFESIAVGVSNALASGRPIEIQNIKEWLNSNEFFILTESDASNSLPKLNDRIGFVTAKLLADKWEPTSASFIKALSGVSPYWKLEQDEDEEKFGEQFELFL